MGWTISLVFMGVYIFTKDIEILYVSGLFAIAGSFEFVSNSIRDLFKFKH